MAREHRITYNGWFPWKDPLDLQSEIDELRSNPAAAAGPVIRDGVLSGGNRQADEPVAAGFLLMDNTNFYPEVYSIIDVVFPAADIILGLFLSAAARNDAMPLLFAGTALSGVAADHLLWTHRSTRQGLVQVGVTASPQFTAPDSPELHWLAINKSASAKLLDFPVRILGMNRKEFDPNPPDGGGGIF